MQHFKSVLTLRIDAYKKLYDPAERGAIRQLVDAIVSLRSNTPLYYLPSNITPTPHTARSPNSEPLV